MCESEKWKAQMLHDAFPHVPHVFSDMKELPSGRGFDYVSKQSAPVPKVACPQ